MQNIKSICEEINKHNMENLSKILQMEITIDIWERMNKANKDLCYLLAVAGWKPDADELFEIKTYIKEIVSNGEKNL